MRTRQTIVGLLLLYQALFLNVFLPGHTRGAITLDGRHMPACCANEDGTSAPTSRDSAVPSSRDRATCAVCHFAATASPPPIVGFTLPELGLLELLPPPAPLAVASVERIRTYLACGPPRVAIA